MREPATLKRYLVDRAQGVTAAGGISQIVVLVLEDVDGHEHCFALSKVDGYQLAVALQRASVDAQQG